MPNITFSPAAQHWINVVLLWLGFGTLVGLLMTLLFPLRQPTGAFGAVVLGVGGSALGLLALSRIFPHQQFNPISPLGFLAATIGAFVLLILYRLGCMLFSKHES